MNELHLFAGIGGGILGGILLGHRCVGAVEIDPYCRRVLEARQRDGILPEFPIHDDIRTFDGTAWRGRVDVVCGGFPCQDVSVAGKRAGLAGERSGLWWEMLRVVREVGPRYVFVENVPGLLVRGFDRVLGSLAELGFDAEWVVRSAADVGAPHLRKRLWVLAAHADSEQHEGGPYEVGRPRAAQLPAHADRGGPSQQPIAVAGCVAAADAERHGGEWAVADASRVGRGTRRPEPTGEPGRPGASRSSGAMGNTNRPRQLQPEGGERDERRRATDPSWWATEPRVGRVAHGVPSRVDRLRALGNAQVPAVAAAAFIELMERHEPKRRGAAK